MFSIRPAGLWIAIKLSLIDRAGTTPLSLCVSPSLFFDAHSSICWPNWAAKYDKHMTDRLYYRDSKLRYFDANVVSAIPAKRNGSSAKSDHWWVTLDRTAFYPTSGGQPYDIGSLGEAKVTDVFEDADCEIIHVTDRPLALGPVHGSIEFGRRFDHMQQHTGSHLVSTAFLELFSIPTISFHLGHEVSTIDLTAPSISPEQIQAVEQKCNHIIRENLRITARIEHSVDLAEALPNHRAPSNKILRVIEIQGWNEQPCGGTHVESTGEIGVILLRKLAKARGNFRLEFVCGGRATRAAQHDFAIVQEATRQLSCTFENLPTAISSIVEERDTGLRACGHLRNDMADLQAEFLLVQQSRVGRRGFPIVHIFENRDSEYIKLVALRLIQTPGTVAFLGSRLKGEVVFAQAPGLPADMSALFRSVVLSAGGRGGGTRELAQGIVKDPKNLEMLLTQACEQLHPCPEPGTSRLRSTCEAEFVRRPRRSAIGG